MTLGDRIKCLRKQRGMTLNDLSKIVGIPVATISRYETGAIPTPSLERLDTIAAALGTTTTYLLGYTDQQTHLISFPVIGSVKAGFNGVVNAEYTGDVEFFPADVLKGKNPEDYFVLLVSGDSMYPEIKDGDRALCLRVSSVDSGSTAVILYDGDDVTIKKVNYIRGQDFLDLIPINPMFKPQRISGVDLERCRVLGKVVKIVRDID